MLLPYTVTLTIRIPSAQHARGALAAAKWIGKQGRLDEFIITENATPDTANWRALVRPRGRKSGPDACS
jgi:hypothetical protein